MPRASIILIRINVLVGIQRHNDSDKRGDGCPSCLCGCLCLVPPPRVAVARRGPAPAWLPPQTLTGFPSVNKHTHTHTHTHTARLPPQTLAAAAHDPGPARARLGIDGVCLTRIAPPDSDRVLDPSVSASPARVCPRVGGRWPVGIVALTRSSYPSLLTCLSPPVDIVAQAAACRCLSSESCAWADWPRHKVCRTFWCGMPSPAAPAGVRESQTLVFKSFIPDSVVISIICVAK